ncbi:pyridoxamine 5'-phosphate oxidase family protein [Muricauda sp. CAU 1633]|uniref:pyridoxamine 5'-phosphate oxidase family protein n=1 Tax=Allomuricauda sp. CAU 1633 TaxID=2816036 RepID=UPI001A90A389|nr:pyridoxamine 5'-phosphate oxidase family protein [Muricauda sp. CAU 1633]MBO0323759.1 pyridoxamine 5'-phosphate oxidase family protein [Muricauda sp. CAU 1633]
MSMISDLEPIKCTGLLADNYVGHLAYIANNEPHVVPSTYFFDEEHKCILCFASNGHRINALRKYNKVSFQVDSVESFRYWQSVQVHGTFEELTGDYAKLCLKRFADGVQRTIDHKNAERPHFLSHFSGKLQETEMPVVYRIAVTKITGKSVEDFT